VRAPLSNPAAVDPEEALVASLSSCHMLFFLSYAAAGGFVIDRYEDEASGEMGKNAKRPDGHAQGAAASEDHLGGRAALGRAARQAASALASRVLHREFRDVGDRHRATLIGKNRKRFFDTRLAFPAARSAFFPPPSSRSYAGPARRSTMTYLICTGVLVLLFPPYRARPECLADAGRHENGIGAGR